MGRLLRSAFSLSVATLAAAGCEEHHHHAPPPAVVEGTLIIDWTIDGAKDPNLCVQSGAATISITVTGESGVVGTFEQACTVFATTIALLPGSYVATAVLLDASRAARTTEVAINPFSIFGNTSLTIPIDFPANSFF
jgi:hypothetical protein